MLRSAAGKLAASAAGVAASGPPAQPQCRAQQPRAAVHSGKEDGSKGPAHAVLPDIREEQIDKEWLLTDLKHALEEDQVVFSYDEIHATMNSVLAFTSGDKAAETAAQRLPASSSVQIHELDGDESECGSDLEGKNASANLHIQAAEMQLVAPQAVKEDFTRMLSTLLHNSNVQSACVQALRNDPAFQEILDSTDFQGSVDVPMHSFIPLSAQAAGITQDAGENHAEENNSFTQMIENLANRLMHFGEAVMMTALGARDAIGRLFIKIGYNLHDLLGQPFSNNPLEECNPDEESKKAEVVGNALITAALAILTIVLLKRVHRIRFV